MLTAPLRVLVLALALLVAAVPATSAHKKRTSASKNVTGTTTLALNADATKALNDLGITVTPIAPATAGEGGFAFPVEKVKLKRRHLKVKHDGGVNLTKGDVTVALTDFVLKAHRRHGKLFARAGDSRRKVPLLKLRGFEADRSDDTLTVTANAFLTRAGANGLNQAFGTDAFEKGDAVGTTTTVLQKSQGTSGDDDRRKKHHRGDHDDDDHDRDDD